MNVAKLSTFCLLRQGAICRLVLHRGEVLRVHRGRVWATRRHDPQDYFVGAGQCLPASDEEWLIQAEWDSVLVRDSPQPTRVDRFASG